MKKFSLLIFVAVVLTAMFMNIQNSFEGYGIVKMKTVHDVILADDSGTGTDTGTGTGTSTNSKKCYIYYSGSGGKTVSDQFCDPRTKGEEEEELYPCPSVTFSTYDPSKERDRCLKSD